MTSPFSTFDEFSSADGPIYAFANSPSVVTFLILLSAVISLYFIYASFGMKQDFEKPATGSAAIAVLIATGISTMLSLVPGYAPARRTEAAHPRPSAAKVQTAQRNPISGALLGLTGMVATGRGKRLGRRVRPAVRSARRR
ncbi:MAG: hypothetical protein Fur0046_12020 [Cyanobacteria bacterium J069]|nr:MAG: hypothetical protein D6742_02020 [Cyanobacteria bacterium J069]